MYYGRQFRPLPPYRLESQVELSKSRDRVESMNSIRTRLVVKLPPYCNGESGARMENRLYFRKVTKQKERNRQLSTQGFVVYGIEGQEWVRNDIGLLGTYFTSYSLFLLPLTRPIGLHRKVSHVQYLHIR